jgi:hypothetical protein
MRRTQQRFVVSNIREALILVQTLKGFTNTIENRIFITNTMRSKFLTSNLIFFLLKHKL